MAERALPPDPPETEQLLAGAERSLRGSRSCSGSLAGPGPGPPGPPSRAASGSISSASAAASTGQLQPAPPSPSLSRRGSAAAAQPAPPARPPDYLPLAILACFCPVWPVNVVALVFSIMSRNSRQQGDVDGAWRLGRMARLISTVCIILGTIIIVLYFSLNFTVFKKN
ncbi:trafficking regulator of GLUT4 1 [Alligator mississippiensis]|uniref:trafficking regulator of GLUT4 1 n=1 Tax=Alligator mississippiensis TaxID=8496 RepID=UPI0028778307|nr:trafficking regulator of GLUT4 1 [Alligator mississippiensis]